MMKKREVVMLSTEKASNIILQPDGKLEHLKEITSKEIGVFKHLYILSNETVELNDWIFDGEGIGQLKNPKGLYFINECKKIIAISNPEFKIYNSETLATASGFSLKTDSIALPQLPQDFIEAYIREYNAGNPIKEIMVEYDVDTYWTDNSNLVYFKPKLRNDNTIIIHRVKEEKWSRNKILDMLELYEKYFKVEIIGWFNRNYPE